MRAIKTKQKAFPWDSVFFDFDGVLVDSLPVKDAAFKVLFRNESLAHRRAILAYHRREGGLSRGKKFKYIFREILHRPLTKITAVALAQRFEEWVEDRVAQQPLVRGTRPLLRFLMSRARLHVVSGTPEAELRRLVRRMNLIGFFRGGVYGSPPDKTRILKRLLTKGVMPSRALFVGDSRNDMEAARQCGVPFIARRSRRGDWRGHRGIIVRDMAQLQRRLTRKNSKTQWM